ncbi:AMP-binding protein [Arsenophonus nasoniae]|uniref:AMP-binding protein n=1 Tax=Arsenophonus nasoniae TaxID=638 RepID=A0AA95K1I9_9GAMM|nr:AMP-binding protein [Arsenophonus nasoniae]WGL96719.1 AMP-binding protein [Arsenophonus nasoniae]
MLSIYKEEMVWNTVKDKIATLFQLPAISQWTYPQFSQSIPVMEKKGYLAKNDQSLHLLNSKNSYLIGFTSGTSGTLKRCLYKMSGDVYNVKECEEYNIFCSTDTCANLFTINLLFSAHCLFSNVASACGANIISIGDFNVLASEHFDALIDVNTNVLIGIPCEIIQFIQVMQKKEKLLAINKVIFAGEALKAYQREIIKNTFGNDVHIIGAYACSEAGIIAFSLGEDNNSYELLTNQFFIERYQDRLLITSLDNMNVIPLLRYNLGDSADISLKGNIIRLTNIKRNNISFNFMGYIIEYETIVAVVHKFHPADISIQIHLSVAKDTREVITVWVPTGIFSPQQIKLLEKELTEIPDIYESKQLNQGYLVVNEVDPIQYIRSVRGKILYIVDNRD